MEDMDQLYTALRNADKAGDAEGARRIAQYINSIDGSQEQKPIQNQTMPKTRSSYQEEMDRVNGQVDNELKARNQTSGDPMVIEVGGVGMDENGNPITSQQPSIPTDPTDGMSTYDKIASGAGKSVVDMWRGGKQIGASIGNNLGLVSDNTFNNIQKEIDEAKRLDAPLMNTGAGMAGYIGGNIATTLIPLGLAGNAAKASGMTRSAAIADSLVNPSTYKAATASGALQGALMPTATGESRALNAGIGAVSGIVGNGIVNGVGRIAQPVKVALDSAGSKAVQVLKDAGVPLDAAQLTGSPILTRFKSVLSDNPFTVGGQQAVAQAQQDAYNSALLKTIGAEGNRATQDVMSAAKNRIGGKFDEIASKNSIWMDEPLDLELTNIRALAKQELNDSQSAILDRQLENIVSKADSGAIDGKAYLNIKQSLDRLSKGSDSSVGYWAREIRQSLDRGAERSMGEADYKTLQEARKQWGNMKTIEGAIDKEGLGNISPARLSNSLYTKQNRAKSVYGAGDQELVDLANSGKQLLPDKLPNSGTAARWFGQVALPAAGGVAAGYGTGDWSSGAKTGLGLLGGAYVAPKLFQYMINNPSTANYLANGISPGLSRSIMLAPETSGLLGGVTRRVVPSSTNGLLAR